MFSLFVTPGKVLADAFSLKPENTRMGWRPEVIEGLKRVNPGVIRFPGGCFASFHDWRNAIGPMDRRVPEDSYFWGDVNYNDVGTDEFLQLCELLGCQAMLVVNLFHPGKNFIIIRVQTGTRWSRRRTADTFPTSPTWKPVSSAPVSWRSTVTAAWIPLWVKKSGKRPSAALWRPIF